MVGQVTWQETVEPVVTSFATTAGEKDTALKTVRPRRTLTKRVTTVTARVTLQNTVPLNRFPEVEVVVVAAIVAPGAAVATAVRLTAASRVAAPGIWQETVPATHGNATTVGDMVISRRIVLPMRLTILIAGMAEITHHP